MPGCWKRSKLSSTRELRDVVRCPGHQHSPDAAGPTHYFLGRHSDREGSQRSAGSGFHRTGATLSVIPTIPPRWWWRGEDVRQESTPGLVVCRRKPFQMPQRIRKAQPMQMTIVATFPATACVWFSYSSCFTCLVGKKWNRLFAAPNISSAPSSILPHPNRIAGRGLPFAIDVARRPTMNR